MSRKERDEPRPIAEGEEDDWTEAGGPRPRAALGITISLRLDPQLASRVRAAADEDSLTVSEFVRQAVNHELDRREVLGQALPGEFRERLADVERAVKALAKVAEVAQGRGPNALVEPGTSGVATIVKVTTGFGSSVGYEPEKVELADVG